MDIRCRSRVGRTVATASGAILAAGALLIAFAYADTQPRRQMQTTEHRVRVNSAEYPWSAIGRVNKAIGGHCTGALVGRRLVITAAHCIWNPNTRQFLAPQSIHFVAGYRVADYIQHAKAERIFIPKEYLPESAPTGANAIYDWALVVLEQDVGDVTGYLGIAYVDAARLKTLKRAHAVFVQAGYSRDQRQVLTAHFACPLGEFVEGGALIAHKCEAVPGDSGSPILMAEDGRIRVVAIHVATTQETAQPIGAAVPVASFADGIRELGAGEASPPPAGTLVPRDSVCMLLTRLGYEPEPNLSAAIESFQKARGLKQTGEVSHALLAQLIQALK